MGAGCGGDGEGCVGDVSNDITTSSTGWCHINSGICRDVLDIYVSGSTYFLIYSRINISRNSNIFYRPLFYEKSMIFSASQDISSDIYLYMFFSKTTKNCPFSNTIKIKHVSKG